jgi:hypothetical protein
VTDADSTDFNGGSLTVSLAANGTSTDQLTIINQGSAAGQIGVSGSNVTYGGTTIGTLTGGSNGTDLVITFNSGAATAAAVQALARDIAFSNTSEVPSTATRTVSFTVADGDGGSNSGSAMVDVTAVNDAPVNNVPASQSVAEDGVLVFSAGATNAISISDADAGGKPVQLTLTATHGGLSLSGTTGLTFTAGDGSADATMTFHGTLADVNAALEGMSFAPALHFSGAASIQITTDDQGAAGSGGALIDTDAISVAVQPSGGGGGGGNGGGGGGGTGGDTTPPGIVGFAPGSGTTGAPFESAIVVSFSEPVVLGAGTVSVLGASGSASAQLGVQGSQLTIHLQAPLDPGATYVLSIGADAVADLAGIAFAGANATLMVGQQGDDTLMATAADDMIDGLAGLDSVVYAGNHTDSIVAHLASGFSVNGPEGMDALENVERIQFGDGYAMGLDLDGSAGEAYRLYGAAFDRAPDLGGLGFWINALDHGVSLQDVAAAFVSSDEFTTAYGAINDDQFVTQLYANLLHRAPDAVGLAFWEGVLQRGIARGDVLVGFSESAENIADVIGTIQDGILYMPWV